MERFLSCLWCSPSPPPSPLFSLLGQRNKEGREGEGSILTPVPVLASLPLEETRSGAFATNDTSHRDRDVRPRWAGYSHPTAPCLVDSLCLVCPGPGRRYSVPGAQVAGAVASRRVVAMIWRKVHSLRVVHSSAGGVLSSLWYRFLDAKAAASMIS